jgi:hypothetical protein
MSSTITETAAREAPAPTPPSDTRASDRLFGAVGIAAILLAAFFFVFGDADSGAAALPDDGVPQLRILSPDAGAALAQPALLEFDAGVPLRLGPTGWTAGDLHLHLYAGDTEVMPTSGDLQRIEGTRYVWRLPRLPAGERTLRLQWAGTDHRSMEQGASEALPVQLR